MAKKNFKAGASGLDKLFTSDEELAHKAQTKPDRRAKTHETHETHETQRKAQAPRQAPRQEATGVYRLNLRLNREFKEHLTAMSWENRVTITEYLNSLIKADMNKKTKGVK